MTRRRALIALAVVALASGAVYGGGRHFLPEGRVLPGVRVEGFEVPEGAANSEAALRALLALRVDASLDRDVELTVGKDKRTLRLRDFVTANVEAALARARQVGHAGGLALRLDEALRARKGQIDVAIPLAVDAAALEKLVATIKEQVDEPPTDAKLDLEKHGVVPDREGHALEIDGAIATLEAELRARALDGIRLAPTAKPPAVAALSLPLATHPARVTEASLAKLDIGTVVGTFETHFGRGGDQSPRAVNIENAAKKLDGLVLEPGALVSFNAVVGERSEANGFKVAWEIFKGEMRPGVGGGTCQVSSTFHAAAFFGGLDVLERLPHSRPSAYIPMGLDSTVVYPVVDLKLRNPHPFPVVVHTKVGANKLTVEILGKEKAVSVVFGRDVVDVYPYARKIQEEPWVKEGQAIKKQGGIRGYRVRRVRTLKYASGSTKTETSYDFYPPTTEIYVVAPGTDPGALPALPDDVQEMIAKKSGEPPKSSSEVAGAVACAGECGEKPALEIKNAAGVHDNVGDQANPAKSMAIGH